jgi:predicted nucleic acid-binding protein
MLSSIYFLDTSALFKRYVEETGSDVVERLFNAHCSCFISSLTLVEVVSNLRRLVDVDGVLTEEEFIRIRGLFLAEVADLTLQVLDMTPKVIMRSLEICSSAYTSPIDAVQLASALSIPGGSTFLGSDKRLLRMAAMSGLNTINPED